MSYLGAFAEFLNGVIDKVAHFESGIFNERLFEKGGGIYLGPSESATIQAASGASLKLFHLVVPQIPK